MQVPGLETSAPWPDDIPLPPDDHVPPPEDFLVPPDDMFAPPDDDFVPPPDDVEPPWHEFAAAPAGLGVHRGELVSVPDGFEAEAGDFAVSSNDSAFRSDESSEHAEVRPGDGEFGPDPDEVSTEPAVDPDDPEGWAADVDALLAERAATLAAEREVELPGQIPATALVEMRADPSRLARRLRRPLPYPPNPLARRGTAFHAWVQRWFSGTRLLGLDELPGAGVPESGEVAADAELARMQDAFLNSAWAHRSPIDVEVPFETSIAGVVIRGRMDAVFAEPDGRWVVVDWKTGAEPDGGDEAAVAMQLAIYRLAWARLMAARHGIGERAVLDRVGAAFHYIRTGRTIAPADLPGPDELAELISASAPPRDDS